MSIRRIFRMRERESYTLLCWLWYSNVICIHAMWSYIENSSNRANFIHHKTIKIQNFTTSKYKIYNLVRLFSLPHKNPEIRAFDEMELIYFTPTDIAISSKYSDTFFNSFDVNIELNLSSLLCILLTSRMFFSTFRSYPFHFIPYMWEYVNTDWTFRIERENFHLCWMCVHAKTSTRNQCSYFYKCNRCTCDVK